MKTILEKLIADYRKIYLSEGISRDVHFPSPLPNKARVITGVRRCGKTWLLYQIIQRLQKENGIPDEKILYLNFEDERFGKEINFSEIIETFYSMYPQTDNSPYFFFFDEIQNFPGWERFVRRLLETENIRLYLTGSSAKLLSREIATSLRGRSLSTELFPFTFKEFLKTKRIETKTDVMPDARMRGVLVNYFQQFILEGGFPEAVRLDEIDRISLLQEYVRSIMYRDIVERHRVTNLKALKHLVSTVLNSPASLFSISRFYNYLKSLQIPCKKDLLYSYMSYLHDAYLFFPVHIHTRSEKVRQVNPSKLYIVDTGLAHAHSQWPEPDWGHLFENFVFLELKKRNFKINYYKTRSGKEIDFFVYDNVSKKTFLVQASLDIKQVSTHKRERKALEEAMNETGIKDAWIVTANTFGDIDTPSGKIKVVPGWWWSLVLDREIEQSRKKQKNLRMPGL